MNRDLLSTSNLLAAAGSVTKIPSAVAIALAIITVREAVGGRFMSFGIPKGLKPVSDFVVQVIVGAVLFTLVLIVAVALAGLVVVIESLGFAPKWLITGAHWLEWGLFWLDAFSFGLFLIAEVAKLARGLWREWNHG